MAIDEEYRFHGGSFGSKKLVTHPAMRALVRRGVAALPDLLEHLTDDRPTKLIIVHQSIFGGFVGMGPGYEYDPRDPNRPPAIPSLSPPSEKGDLGKYTIKVGDLCFVAVGQIVNRGLSVLRYQPTACLFINSPVHIPALAAATREDWSGLTTEQHRESLTKDARDKSLRYHDALLRLLFYYPATGEDVARRALSVDSLRTREGADEVIRVIEVLAGVQNEKIDEAVLALFRAPDLKKFKGFDRVWADDVALACMERLVGKGTDAEFAAYCRGRIEELKARKREIAEEQRLGFLTTMLGRLRPEE
jgi:hypothetical protein